MTGPTVPEPVEFDAVTRMGTSARIVGVGHRTGNPFHAVPPGDQLAAIKADLATGPLKPELAAEVAEVLSFALLRAHDLVLDSAERIAAKLTNNQERYHVGKSRSKATKYDKLEATPA
jgi:hypothetical protein